MRGVSLGPERLTAIYAGLDSGPLSYDEWEVAARSRLADGPFGYVAGGAGGEDTLRANREAFYRWRLRPRMLRGVQSRDLSVELLGTRLPVPVLLAPVGVLGIVRPDGDLAAARAAAAAGIPFVASTVSSAPLEDIAGVMGQAHRWFQLYPGLDREVSASFIRRAEQAGFSAVVITVDTTLLGWRELDLRSAYLPFLQGEGLANFISDPVFRSRLAHPAEAPLTEVVPRWLATFPNPAMGWGEIDFLRSVTRLPLVLKGITHPDDARLALEHDIDALVISNHGGRQVDGAVASLDALPHICEAIAGAIPVLLDSGVRRGADVLKALALGARAVLIGRPYAFALAATGEEGVARLLRNLCAELDLQVALCGCSGLAEVNRDLVERAEST